MTNVSDSKCFVRICSCLESYKLERKVFVTGMYVTVGAQFVLFSVLVQAACL